MGWGDRSKRAQPPAPDDDKRLATAAEQLAAAAGIRALGATVDRDLTAAIKSLEGARASHRALVDKIASIIEKGLGTDRAGS